MAWSENLTIMFTDMVGYTETTSSQSREENEQMLRKHDRVMSPIIRQFAGRKIKAIGDAFLVTFRSSTDAVQCGMAMHDAIAEYNQARPDEHQLQIRVAIHVGEVRVENNDVFGEAVNIAARIEGMTPPNEVYFSHSVYLAMNKAEIPSEVVGTYKLKGIPERVKIHCVPTHSVTRLQVKTKTDSDDMTGLPFGGVHKTRRVSRRLPEISGKSLQRLGAAALVLVIVAALGLFAYSWMQPDTLDQAEPLLVAGEWQKAVELAEARLRSDSSDAGAMLIKGHVNYARNKMTAAREAYMAALEENPDLRTDPRLIRNLVASADDKGFKEIIVKFTSSALEDALQSRAGKPGYWGRYKALQGLAAIDKRDLADPLQVGILDLKEAPKCELRLDAVKRLRKLGDRAALPALEDAVGDIKSKVQNLCLWNEARKTIDELGG